MRRPLLLGMCDPSGTEPLGLDHGRQAAGARLLAISGLSREEFESAFERANLLPGRVWRPLPARRAGQRLLREKPEGRIVVVLGRETWRALGLPAASPGAREGDFVFLPHPSGRNLYYNSRARRLRARRLLREIANG